MADLEIECPHCHHSFKLNETLAAPLVADTRRTLEKEFESKNADANAKQTAADKALKEVAAAKAAIAKQQEDFDSKVAASVAAGVAEGKAAIESAATKKAQLAADAKLNQSLAEKSELERTLKAQTEKLAEAQKAQTDAVRKQRELDEKIREVDLTAEKKAAELVAPAIEKAKKEADEAARMRVAEKDKTITDLQEKLQDAIRKAEQGSQQLQGEVQELDLEATLRSAFPRDIIEPVPKGKFGGDTLHRVAAPLGNTAGTILWESKRTKTWSDGWLAKLRGDMRDAKAEICAIVTSTLPKGIDSFGQVEGVWVCDMASAVPLAMVLRFALMEVSTARQSSEGKQTKMELVYSYLTGPSFRQRVEAIKEAFENMREDLEAEKKVILKQWAKRDKQIEAVIASTVGMYGDLQGIAGKSMPEIDGLDIKQLGSSANKETQ